MTVPFLRFLGIAMRRHCIMGSHEGDRRAARHAGTPRGRAPPRALLGPPASGGAPRGAAPDLLLRSGHGAGDGPGPRAAPLGVQSPRESPRVPPPRIALAGPRTRGA